MSKRYRHLNFFQHECYLEVRILRVKLPDGAVRQVEPEWAGRLKGFTLLFEALVLMLAREMRFAALARLVGESWHRVAAICRCYVELALADADFSAVRHLAIDDTSRARGHAYVTLAADLKGHSADPGAIASASIDMSPAFIKGCAEHLPSPCTTFDKFHVIADASAALDQTRRIEQKTDPALKGLRWKLLRDYRALGTDGRAEIDALLARVTTQRTARAWVYRE